MIKFKNGLDYKDYIKTGTNEDLEMNKEFYKKSPIHNSKENIEIKEKTNIAVFSMTRCKDAATVTPVLLELAQNNANINIKFFDKAGNEDLLENLTGEVRIPTILKLDDKGNIKDKFVEFPKEVKVVIEKNPKNKDIIVSDFRNDKYFDSLKSEIIRLLK